MNSKFIKASLLLVSMSVLALAGCGPQEFNDSENVARVADNGSGDILSKADQGADEPNDSIEDAPNAPSASGPAAGGGEGGGCPTGGCPAGGAAGGGCPTGNCEIPPDPDTNRTVQLPDQVQTEATKVIPTGEKQVATDIVDYHTTRHIWQPSERHHTVHKHRNLERRHFTKIVYHPTMKRINRVIRTASSSDQVMPTEEVVEPTIDYGCPGIAPEPAPQPALVRFRPVPVPVYPARIHPYGY